MSRSRTLDRVLDLARIDVNIEHQPPGAARVVLASIVALAGSLVAGVILVAIGKAVFPSLTHYVHFQLSDYGKLTVIGVLIACAAWPIVTRISWAPRWMFLRMAVAVTLVLWLPDVYILVKGQPAKAVGVLMLMHLAIAVVTYNALVRLAPIRARRAISPTATPPATTTSSASSSSPP